MDSSNAAGRKLEAASLNLIAVKAEYASVLQLVVSEQVGFERMTVATESVRLAQCEADQASRQFVTSLKDQYRLA